MKNLYCFLFFIVAAISNCLSQGKAGYIFRIDSLVPDGVLLDKGWKFHAGDNPEWASTSFDDNGWENINPTLVIHYLPQIRKEPIGWFRIHLHVDSSLLNKPLAFQVYQSIASEIYSNGKLLQKYGIVSPDKNKVKAFDPLVIPISTEFKTVDQVIAVRFSVQENLFYLKNANSYLTFQFYINDVSGAGNVIKNNDTTVDFDSLYMGLFLVLTIIHLGLYLIYKRQIANLFFSVATFSGFMANFLWLILTSRNNIALRTYLTITDYVFLLTLFNLFLFVAIHHLFARPKNFYYWGLIVYSLVSIVFWFAFYESGEAIAFFLPFALSMFVSLRIAWRGYRKRQRDAGIIVTGLACYLIIYSFFLFFYLGYLPAVDIGFGEGFTMKDFLYQVAQFCMPVALSLYLSRDFAFTSNELEKKLSEVQQLSADKQQILISQNETLEQQVTERTSALNQSLEELKATQSQLIHSEKMASLGELTAGIAHEIQNPLNFVNNFSEVNKELLVEMKDEMNKGNYNDAKTIADDVIENQEKINQHGKRADAIVKGMLQHSRSSTGVKEPTDINALADEYLRLAYHGMRSKDKTFNATMQTDFDSSIGKINIIPQDIGRVLLNLYNNAFYAVNEKKKNPYPLKGNTEYEPTVSVITEKQGNKILISVKDNGNGIPQNMVDKIFQPFFTTKPTGHGTGLGLSLAYDIVKAHGGKLEVKTKENEGSQFIICLPFNETS